MYEITEYDDYTIDRPYANRVLTEKEEKARAEKFEETKKKVEEMIKDFK